MEANHRVPQVVVMIRAASYVSAGWGSDPPDVVADALVETVVTQMDAVTTS